jgi:hypothetical protein
MEYDMTVSTNASCTAIAETLEGARWATFSGIIQRLKGFTRGRGAGKLQYADALVHDVIVTGFKYRKLKARDLKKLEAITDADLMGLVVAGHDAWDHPRRKTAALVGITLSDYKSALAELIDSCKKSIAGTNTATHDDVFEQLEVDGKKVPGARVYVGPSDPTKKPASKPGTVYLSGLRVGRKVLDEPANGWGPKGKSGVKATAKRLVAKLAVLPSSRYVSYRLDPESGYILNLGGQAAVAADKDGMSCRPDVVAEVKLALAS